MRIVETTLTDLVPKMIIFCLIHKTVRQYVEKSDFLGEMLKVEAAGDLDMLVRRHDAVEERIRQLVAKREELIRVQGVVLDTSEMDEI